MTCSPKGLRGWSPLGLEGSADGSDPDDDGRDLSQRGEYFPGVVPDGSVGPLRDPDEVTWVQCPDVPGQQRLARHGPSDADAAPPRPIREPPRLFYVIADVQS